MRKQFIQIKTRFPNLNAIILAETHIFFGRNLKTLISNAGIRSADLAEELNVNATTVSNWSNDKIIPNLETIQRIAEYFKVSLADIITRDLRKFPALQEAPAPYQSSELFTASQLALIRDMCQQEIERLCAIKEDLLAMSEQKDRQIIELKSRIRKLERP